MTSFHRCSPIIYDFPYCFTKHESGSRELKRLAPLQAEAHEILPTDDPQVSGVTAWRLENKSQRHLINCVRSLASRNYSSFFVCPTPVYALLWRAR